MTNKQTKGRSETHFMEHCVVVVSVPPSEAKVPSVAQLAKSMRQKHRQRGPSGLPRFPGTPVTPRKESSVTPHPGRTSSVASMVGAMRRKHRALGASRKESSVTPHQDQT